MKKSKMFLIVIILLLLLPGCQQNKEQTEIKPKDKAPDSLNDLSTGIGDILSSLGDIERLTLNIPLPEKKKEEEGHEQGAEQGKKQEEEQSAGGSQSGSESQGGQGEGEQSGGQEGQGQQGQQEQGKKPEETQKDQAKMKEEQIKSLWESIEKKLEEIHPLWNSFQVEGLKKGATKESMDKFETAFNKMTKSVETKTILEIYDYASQSLANLKPVYDLYLDEVGGDISVIKHSAYQGYIRALQGDIEGAETFLSNKEENINKLRLKMTKEEDKDAIEKISLSLTDFRDSLPENSRRLFMIKKDIIIENLKAIEK